MNECIHDMAPGTCGICRGIDDNPRRGSGLNGGEVKQDVLDQLCDVLGISRVSVGVGSSIPSEVFAAAARRAGVPKGSMPEICEAVVEKAGMRYSSAYDSRGSLSGGGSTVTAEGLRAMVTALARLDG